MVVIKKRSNVIPVDFGEFQLNFPLSDSNLKRMEEVGKDLEAKSMIIQDTDNKEAIDASKGFIEDAFKQIFDDEEAFKLVYAFAGESTSIAMFYLIKTINGIRSEFENQNSKAAFDKYLAE